MSRRILPAGKETQHQAEAWETRLGSFGTVEPWAPGLSRVDGEFTESTVDCDTEERCKDLAGERLARRVFQGESSRDSTAETSERQRPLTAARYERKPPFTHSAKKGFPGSNRR